MATTINPNSASDQDPVKLNPGLLVHLNDVDGQQNLGKFRPDDLVPGSIVIKAKKVAVGKNRVKFTISFEVDNVEVHTKPYEIPREEMESRGSIDMLPKTEDGKDLDDPDAEYSIAGTDAPEIFLENPDDTTTTLSWRVDFESGGGKVRGVGL
jgi:hypothetical protein